MSGKIATHEFTVMTGQVPHLAGATEKIERAGEDGYILRRIGERTPTFQVKTWHTFATEIAGINKKLDYADLASAQTGPHDFEMNGVDYTAEATLTQNYKVWVVKVKEDEFARKSCISGTTNRWSMDLTWTLILAPV